MATWKEQIATNLAQLGEIEVKIARLEARMNEKLNNIKETFTQQVQPFQNEADLMRLQIKTLCDANKSEFIKTRSLNFDFGTVSYRNNPPKVGVLNRKYNLKTALELLRKIFPRFIRTKEEIDKEAILSEYAQASIKDDQLAAVGLKIDQDETFSCEINWAEFQNK